VKPISFLQDSGQALSLRSDRSPTPAHKRLFFLFVTLLLAVTCLLLPVKQAMASSDKPSYTLGVFPNMPPQELESVFGPIAAAISKAIDADVTFKTSSTYQMFMDKLNEQAFDIAYVQPFDYVHIADKYGYKPLAAMSEPLATMFVVKVDSNIEGFEDLRGKKIGFPPPVAAVSYLGKAYLKKRGFDLNKDIKISHFKSHLSCLQQVVIGTIDACGTAGPMVRYFQYRMGLHTKVIGESPSIPHVLFATHPRVKEEDRKMILKVILSWSKTEEGKEMLKRSKLNSYNPITDDAYDVVRDLKKTLDLE
jgi:phosphonate transport system substrate-binding protein